ncbi:hypothetical protein T492DRAFT_1118179 [Pavlovales sp. CCMP2436]|nr:hypothetical protein T492DRAFT_1118179 [Pavlovales sp. CCMP2436]
MVGTDDVYCIREEGLDYERVLMPHFIIKYCGYIPNSPCGPSLCGLRVKVDALSTNPQTLNFEKSVELKTIFKLRNYELLGPLEARSGKPTIMTGAAGSGKTTLLAMEITQMCMPDCVFVSPTHLFRKDAVLKGFTQTMCHARLLGETRLITEETSRNMAKYPPANILIAFIREMQMRERNLSRGWLVNGSRFTADNSNPIYNSKSMTELIGDSITYCPSSTIHSFQGITFENETLFIDLSYIWDVKKIYVAISRVRRLDQISIIKTVKLPVCHGEGEQHRLEKANQYLEEIMDNNTVIDEYPVGDGRYIADLAAFTD